MTATSLERSEPADSAPAPRDLRLLEAWQVAASPAISVVSTDVFDTLLWRKVPEPVDVFPFVAARLRARGMLAADLEPDSFARLREAAESERRRRRPSGDAEVRLEEIYGLLPDWVFADGSRWEAAEVELEVEQEVLVPDLDVLSLLERAQAAGKKIVAVSDTYFSALQLRRLMAQPGFGLLRFDHIYTSSDSRVNKSGGLFEVALRDLGVEAGQVMHLGDNHEADVQIPGRLGMRTCYFERRPQPFDSVARRERRFEPERADAPAEAAQIPGLTAVRAKVLSRVERAEMPSSLRPFWSYGACVLGPVLTGFAEWIHAHAERHETSRVLFLMREGTFLAELVTRAGAYLGREVETLPFWVNRSLCLRGAIAEVSPLELDKILSRRSPPTVGDLCRSLGLPVSELGEFTSHERTTLEDPILRTNLYAYLAETPAVRALILANARALRERIVAYVQALAGDDEELLVVDLGWGATIQGELVRLLRQVGDERSVRGLYLLTNVRAAQQVFWDIEARGFLGDFGFPERTLDVVMRSPELLEQVCMPAHGSQTGLDEDLNPVLEETYIPPVQQVEAEAVRKGVLAFQREWARYQTALPGKVGSLAHSQRLLRPILARFLASPSPEEAAIFGSWHHDEGQGSDATDTVADPSALPRLRYMTPDQARKLPMTQLYWPFGLAGLADDHWPDLMAAAAAGQVSWDALAAPLDTGTFRVSTSKGVNAHSWSHYEDVPRRNRHGLSMVNGSLHAAHIEEVAFELADRPAAVRIDWIELRCWRQGEGKPIRTRLEGDTLARLRHANCFRVPPNVYLAHGGAAVLVLGVAEITRGIVFRVDFEVAFAAFGSAPLFPAGGAFADLEEADRELEKLRARLRDIESSKPWRVIGPARKVARRLR